MTHSNDVKLSNGSEPLPPPPLWRSLGTGTRGDVHFGLSPLDLSTLNLRHVCAHSERTDRSPVLHLHSDLHESEVHEKITSAR